MRIFGSYVDNFHVEVIQPIDQVMSAFRERIDASKKKSLMQKFVSQEEYFLNGNTFAIKRKRSFFDPFKITGWIKMDLGEEGATKTKVLIQTRPLYNYKDGFAFLIFFLVTFTLLGLWISTSFYSIVTISLGWIVLLSAVHFILKWNQSGLRDYSQLFLKSCLAVKSNFKA